MGNKYNFIERIQKILEQDEIEDKKVLLAGIISSLQQPAKDVVGLIIAKQVQDVNALLESIKKK